MMIIMIALAEPKDADPKIVSAMIGGVEAAVTESGHVADRVDRPGDIVDYQHRHVEAPKHAGDSKGPIKCNRDKKMRQHVDPRTLEQSAIPNLTYIGRITLRALAEFSRLLDQPHHVGIGKAMRRTLNVFVGIGFQMMITMVPYPRDGIARQHHGGACCEYELEPFWHFKTAMGQVTMQIESRANSAPEKKRDDDAQIKRMEACQEPNSAQQLQHNQDDENEKIELFVLKHAAQGRGTKQPTGPQLNPDPEVSHAREIVANRYSRKHFRQLLISNFPDAQ